MDLCWNVLSFFMKISPPARNLLCGVHGASGEMCDGCADPTQRPVEHPVAPMVTVGLDCDEAVAGFVVLCPCLLPSTRGFHVATRQSLGSFCCALVCCLPLGVVQVVTRESLGDLCCAPIVQPTALHAAVRCWMPSGTTTMAVVMTESRPVDPQSSCPLRNVLHHHHLPAARHGMAIAVDGIKCTLGVEDSAGFGSSLRFETVWRPLDRMFGLSSRDAGYSVVVSVALSTTSESESQSESLQLLLVIMSFTPRRPTWWHSGGMRRDGGWCGAAG